MTATMAYAETNALHEKMNEKMIKHVPELDSEYVLAPTSNSDWHKPCDILDDGSPCFVMHAGNLSDLEEIATRQDYIWIPGDVNEELLAGYYHLTTKEAYSEVLRRLIKIDKERKSSNLSNALKLKFRTSDKKEDDRISKKVIQLIKLRLKSSNANKSHSKDTGSKSHLATCNATRKQSNVSAATCADIIDSVEFLVY